MSKSFSLSLILTNFNSYRVNAGQVLVLPETPGTDEAGLRRHRGSKRSFAEKAAGVDMVERIII